MGRRTLYCETEINGDEDVESLPGLTFELTTLSAHVQYLRSMPLEQTNDTVGTDAHDHPSTPFLILFNHTLLRSPNADVLIHPLAMIRHGIIIGHLSYTKEYLMERFYEVQSSSSKIPEKVFHRMFDAFLTLFPTEADIRHDPPIKKSNLSGAIIVLVATCSCGHPIQADRIRENLQMAMRQASRSRCFIWTRDDANCLEMLKELHQRLKRSPCYPVCLRMLIESSEQQPVIPIEELYSRYNPSLEDSTT